MKQLMKKKKKTLGILSVPWALILSIGESLAVKEEKE